MALRLIAVSAVFLAGCAAPVQQARTPAPLYSPPASGPVARLLLRVTHGGGRYTVSTFAQPVSCSQRQEIVSTTVREPERQIVSLAANRLQTLSFMHQPNERQACQVIVSFQPRAGKTYLMRNSADANGCGIELIDASNPDQPSNEASRIVRERLGMGLNDNACKPLTSTQPRPSAAAQPARDEGLEPFRGLLPGR